MNDMGAPAGAFAATDGEANARDERAIDSMICLLFREAATAGGLEETGASDESLAESILVI